MKRQWQIYKDLELISLDVPEPRPIQSAFIDRLDLIWQSRVANTVENLLYPQQAEHLERCWGVAQPGLRNTQRTLWSLLWTTVSQSLFQSHTAALNEPEIRQVTDHAGHSWWCAYNPRTGETTYLESEDEVQVWLEERFYA